MSVVMLGVMNFFLYRSLILIVNGGIFLQRERTEFHWNSAKKLYRAWNLAPFSETMQFLLTLLSDLCLLLAPVIKSFFCFQNCRISSIDFHKTSTCMVTASDDDSIRLYDVASAT